MEEERIKNEGTFEVKLKGNNWPITIDCKDFYIKDNFVVIEHKDGNIEYWPESSVAYIGKRANVSQRND